MVSLSTLIVESLWQLLDDALACLSQHLILSLSRGASGSRLQGQCSAKDGVSGVDGRCDVGVVMETEHLSQIVERDVLLDELDVVGT